MDKKTLIEELENTIYEIKLTIHAKRDEAKMLQREWGVLEQHQWKLEKIIDKAKKEVDNG